jgi:hypothetical protein
VSIFSTENSNETPSFDNLTVDALVGENQKYKTPDDLAKAYANADHRLAQLAKEQAEKDAELKVLREMLEQPHRKAKEPEDNQRSREPDPADDDLENRNPVVKDDKDFATQVREELERATKEKSFADNVNAVSEKLSNFYGGTAKAQEAIQRKAKELQVSPEWLMDVAGRSPAAFYSTVGIDQRSISTPTSESDVNTSAFGRDTNKKNFSYYENIRKTDPKLYYSKELQKEMFSTAREAGAKFYS